jgi:SprT-like family
MAKAILIKSSSNKATHVERGNVGNKNIAAKATKRVKLDRTPNTITTTEYHNFDIAYEFFNKNLFADQLPDVFIQLESHAHMRGYFYPDKFSDRINNKTKVDALVLNPDAFVDRSDEQILSTLVHEMVHGWQRHHGQQPPSRNTYHNKEWAQKMKSIGLYPSNTGAVGGRETGSQMSHYIIPDGTFQQAFHKLQKTKFRLNWHPTPRANRTKARNSKTKFTCEGCGQNCWGKPDLQVRCEADGCDQHPLMQPEQKD